jgi:hypothetical protein
MSRKPNNPNGTLQLDYPRRNIKGLRVHAVLRQDASAIERRVYMIAERALDVEVFIRELVVLGAAAHPQHLETKEMLLELTPATGAVDSLSATRLEKNRDSQHTNQAPVAATDNTGISQQKVPLNFGSTPRSGNRG